jgi:probable addiction module antidote protein
MNTKTVFIGGSREISRLSAEVKERLNNVIKSGHHVVVGDANGADKAIQKHLSAVQYDNVTVFFSGNHPRNNLGHWRTHNVMPPHNVKGFQFYAAKDRQMAREADFGLMIWDSKSPGTILNILRLVRAGKIAVLINASAKSSMNIKSREQWDEFLLACPPKLVADLRARATADELELMKENKQSSFFEKTVHVNAPVTDGVILAPQDDFTAIVNAALTAGDSASVIDALGNLARARGMTQISKDTGLARESLYRSLTSEGNPEFATILKVMASLGLRLEARNVQSDEAA